MVLATYVWARSLNNLVLLNLWYYDFNFHQHILMWKQMKEERPNKQQIEDTSTLFIKSWVSQYFVIDKTTVLYSRSFTEKKDHSIWAFVWAKRCFFWIYSNPFQEIWDLWSIYTWGRTANKSVRKYLSEIFFFFFKYTTLECEGSGFDNHLLSAW